MCLGSREESDDEMSAHQNQTKTLQERELIDQYLL